MKITREQIKKIISMQENVCTDDDVRYFLKFVEVVYNENTMILRSSDGRIALKTEYTNEESHIGRYYFGPDEIVQIKTALKLWPKFPSEFDFTVNEDKTMQINFIQMKVNSNKDSINFPDVDAIYSMNKIENYTVKVLFNAELLNYLNKAMNNGHEKIDSLEMLINSSDALAPIIVNKNNDKALLMPLRSM